MSNTNFILDIFQLLTDNKKYPKYQFERRVDIFIHFFLDEIFKARFGYSPDVILPEFPIKDPINNRSSNIDYLVFIKEINSVFICELKTDISSVGPKQIERYLMQQQNGIAPLLDNLQNIFDNTKVKHRIKYEKLLKKSIDITRDCKLVILYIGPSDLTTTVLNSYLNSDTFLLLSFDELCDLEIQKYPEEYTLLTNMLRNIK